MAPIKRVGFIGLGSVGGPLASNILKGDFELYVSDIDTVKTKKFANKYGATAVDPGSDGFKDVDILISSLPNGNIVRDVLLGSHGYAKTLKPGTIIADMSTADPFNSVNLHKELADLGLEYMDTPITQRKNRLSEIGKITLLIGSDNQEAVERAMPVFKTVSGYIFNMGRVGSGHVHKALNNYVLGASICALADSFVVGAKWGLDPQTMIDAFNMGSARVFATEVNLRDEGLTRRYNSGFAMSLLVKDLKINMNLLMEMGVNTPLAPTVYNLFNDAMSEIGPSVDHMKLLEAWEKWTDSKISEIAQPTTPANPPIEWEQKPEKLRNCGR